METHDIVAVLQESQFFSDLPIDDLRQVATLCREHTYDQGDTVFRQGEQGEHLYTIAEGLIHLERRVNLGSRQATVLIDTLGRGRTLGCWSALLGQAHLLMSSACVQKPTVVVALSGPALRQMMTQDPRFGFKIMERLSFLLRERIQAAYGAMDRF